MKLKAKTEAVPGQFNEDGSARRRVTGIQMTDWQVVALRSAIGIVFALTAIAITWSTWSIGSLLGGGTIGFLAASIFDLGWAVALLLEYMARYDETKRKFPEVLGWVLLAVTMGAIAWDGVAHDSIPMAVVGAFVSAFAKLLWMGVMRHVNAQLTDKDKAELARMTSEAQTKAAIAQVRRTTARIEQKAALELLAMEAEKRQMTAALGLGEATIQNDEPPKSALAIPAPTIGDMGKADAVRFVSRSLELTTAEEVHETLQQERDDITLAYVRQILSRDQDKEPTAEILEFTPAS